MTMTIYIARDKVQCDFYTVHCVQCTGPCMVSDHSRPCEVLSVPTGLYNTYLVKTFTALHPWQQAKWPLHQNSKPNPLLSQAYTVICQVHPANTYVHCAGKFNAVAGEKSQIKETVLQVSLLRFLMNHLPPQLLKITLWSFWIFQKNSWRYSQVKVHHRFQWHRW